MSKIVEFTSSDLIGERACEWVVRLDKGDLSQGEEQALTEWLRESAAHRDALLEMANLMDSFSALERLKHLFPLESNTARIQTKPDTDTDRPEQWHWLPTANIASLAFVLLVAVFLGYQSYSPDSIKPPVLISTNIGDVRTVDLEDGSKVTLNTNSEIDVHYNNNERRIILTRGEALFEVEHGKDRPFIVVARGSEVKAIGTAFNVELADHNIELTVTSGIVEVDNAVSDDDRNSTDIADTKPSRVEAGQVAIISESVDILEEIALVEIEKKLSWKKGVVVFSGESLESVIGEISRYTTEDFLIADDGSKSIRIGGYYEIGDVEEMLDILRNGFNIKVTRTSAGVIHLSSLDVVDVSEHLNR